jgi:hypothetical protein
MNEPVVRSLSTAEIIGSAFQVYREHLAGLVLVAAVPHAVLLLTDTLLVGVGMEAQPLLLVIMLLTMVMNAVALSALTLAASTALIGQPVNVLAIYGQLQHTRFWSMLVAYFVTTMLVSTGFVLLILPGLILGGLFILTVPIVVLERTTPVAAISRSVQLMKVDLMKAVAIFSFTVLVSVLVPLVFQLIAGFGPLSPLLNAVLGSALLPLAYTANVLLYLSARAGEGFTDQQLQAILTESRTE